MNKDNIDKLLQLAWLEGWINTRGAYEKSVLKTEPVHMLVDNGALIAKLNHALDENRSEQSLTVGQMLRSVRSEHKLRAQVLFSRLGLTQNIYRLVERDAISPLKLPVEVWRKMLQVLGLPVDELAGMIRRTHQLLVYRASFRGVLARYDSRKKKGMKKATLEQAYSELYAKANLTMPEEDEKKLSLLIENLRNPK